jgi:integrase
MLRHTCASLLFAKKLQVEIIASILGHSPEVCRKTYIHFCQAQRAEAIHQIAEFNI